MALLTGEIMNDFVAQGYSAQSVATAVASTAGIYSLAIGLLKLGFLLDFVPLPVLSGYVSAAALTIVFGQIQALFGEKNIGSSTGDYIHGFFQKLPQTSWRDFLIGISGIFMLSAMQYIGRRWGKKHRAIWNRKTPLFAISKTVGSGVKAPSAPDLSLVKKLAGRNVAVFIAAALEHLAIVKSFGRRHNYAIDQSQELVFIGLINFVNSPFSRMSITGGFSRTTVNSESGYRFKSPLSGVITTACVLISIYYLTGAFYWIPKATLSAIIITTVWPIVLPTEVFWKYSQTLFTDFMASIVSFWVTLFVSVEYSIAAAVAYGLVYLLLPLTFSLVDVVAQENFFTFYPTPATPSSIEREIPQDTQIFHLNESVLFPNAYRIKTRIMGTVKAHCSRIQRNHSVTERLWDETKSCKAPSSYSSILNIVVIDLTNVNHIDATGIQAFVDLKSELYEFAGGGLDLRFYAMNPAVQKKFQRANWDLLTALEAEG